MRVTPGYHALGMTEPERVADHPFEKHQAREAAREERERLRG